MWSRNMPQKNRPQLWRAGIKVYWDILSSLHVNLNRVTGNRSCQVRELSMKNLRESFSKDGWHVQTLRSTSPWYHDQLNLVRSIVLSFDVFWTRSIQTVQTFKTHHKPIESRPRSLLQSEGFALLISFVSMWGLDLQEETAQQAKQKLVFLRSCCTIGAQYLEGQECYDTLLWLITVDKIGIQHIALLLWDIESSRYECQLIITLAANRFSNVMMTHLLSFSQHIPRKTSEWETQQREYDSCLAVHWNHLKVHGLRHHETRFAQKRDEAGERALKVSGRGSPEWPQVLSFSMFLTIDYVATPTSQQLQIAAGLDGSRGKGARVLWSKAFWPGGRSNCNSLQACRGWAAFQVHLQQLEEEASQAYRSVGMWGLQLQPVAVCCSLLLDLGNMSMSFWFFLVRMPLCSGHLSISFIFSILCGQDRFMFFVHVLCFSSCPYSLAGSGIDKPRPSLLDPSWSQEHCLPSIRMSGAGEQYCQGRITCGESKGSNDIKRHIWMEITHLLALFAKTTWLTKNDELKVFLVEAWITRNW